MVDFKYGSSTVYSLFKVMLLRNNDSVLCQRLRISYSSQQFASDND